MNAGWIRTMQLIWHMNGHIWPYEADYHATNMYNTAPLSLTLKEYTKIICEFYLTAPTCMGYCIYIITPIPALTNCLFCTRRLFYITLFSTLYSWPSMKRKLMMLTVWLPLVMSKTVASTALNASRYDQAVKMAMFASQYEQYVSVNWWARIWIQHSLLVQNKAINQICNTCMIHVYNVL